MKKTISSPNHIMQPYSRNRKSYFWVLCSIFIWIGLLVGCEAEEKLDDAVKTEFQQILALQENIESYQFEGSAGLQIDTTSLVSADNPLTAHFLSMLLNGTITWQGTVQSEPAQLEMDLVIAPDGLPTTVDIPILIKNNKLYFRIPLLQPDEAEYFVVELNETNIKQGTSAWSDTAHSLVDAISPQWYELVDEQPAIRISLTEENYSDIVQSLFEILPSVTTAIKEHISNSVIDQPSQVLISWDEQSFITSYSLQLFISSDVIDIEHSIKQINETPAFTKEIPAEDVLRPFNDIFKVQ